MNKLFQYLRQLDKTRKSTLCNIFISYCLVLFTYPFFRVSTTTIFFESFGAKYSPHAWASSIALISIIIYFLNSTIKKWGIHKLYSIFTIITCTLFLGSYFLYEFVGLTFLGFFLFALKEAYIVIVVHLMLGYCNNYFDVNEVKLLYGPLGGFSSLSAFVGGVITANLSRELGLSFVICVGVFFLLLSIYFFLKTPVIVVKGNEVQEKKTPLGSIADIKEYAILIAVMIALSQFAMTITEMKFNLLFEQMVPDKLQRSEKLGYIYSTINFLSLGIQFFLIPFVATRFSNKKLNYFIPLLYAATFIIGVGIGAEYVIAVAATFVVFKGVDYSLFAITKEVLYQKMNSFQKYGAKYIADMFSYRTAKAIISVFLISFQSPELLNVLVYLFLGLWLICLYFIFYFQSKYFKSA